MKKKGIFIRFELFCLFDLDHNNNVEIHVRLQSVIIDRSMIVDSSMTLVALNNGKTSLRLSPCFL